MKRMPSRRSSSSVSNKSLRNIDRTRFRMVSSFFKLKFKLKNRKTQILWISLQITEYYAPLATTMSPELVSTEYFVNVEHVACDAQRPCAWWCLTWSSLSASRQSSSMLDAAFERVDWRPGSDFYGWTSQWRSLTCAVVSLINELVVVVVSDLTICVDFV